MRGWRGELLLRVVGLLLRGLLGVTRVGLSCRRGSWVATLSWSRLIGHVGHIGHVVLAISVGIVAHRHLEVPWIALIAGVRWSLSLGWWGHRWWVGVGRASGWCIGGSGGGCLGGEGWWRRPGWGHGLRLGLLLWLLRLLGKDGPGCRGGAASGGSWGTLIGGNVKGWSTGLSGDALLQVLK